MYYGDVLNHKASELIKLSDSCENAADRIPRRQPIEGE